MLLFCFVLFCFVFFYRRSVSRDPLSGCMLDKVAAAVSSMASQEASWELVLLWSKDCRLRWNKKMAKSSFFRCPYFFVILLLFWNKSWRHMMWRWIQCYPVLAFHAVYKCMNVIEQNMNHLLKTSEQYFPVVLFIVLFRVSQCMKS